MADTRRRVKLYALNAERQWDDRGTGHVSSLYVEKLKGMSLLVRAEADNSILLESRIHPDTVYQKQQETLIVWSEADNFDLALSFQEKIGCDEIWEKICQVQGSDPSLEVTQDIAEESEDERLEETRGPSPPLELPPCEISRLPEINDFIREFSNTPENKDKLALSIDNESYIRKLLQVFHECETYENLDGLRNLYHIFKNIFLLNKNDLFEIMFSEDLIFDVIGCLEYDPLNTVPKKHRNYLKNNVKFKEALPIQNQELLLKIHQTFRVQYIHDVVIPAPSVFEDNLFPTLSSFVFFNKVEIVTMVQEDDRFLTEFFANLTDESTSERKRRDLILFLKEFFNYSQHLQPQSKENFCKTLTNFGVLTALEVTLCCPDPQTKAASIDILSYIIDFSPSVVRDYALQQANNAEDDQMLINIILEQMICDTDPELGGAVQLVGSLRTLLDPENMLASINKSEKSDFLNFFYKHSFQILIEPLLENTANFELIKDDFQTVQLLSLILELLSFCIEHHTYHIKNCILGKEVLRRILVLTKSSHKFLALCALRFMRKLITLKDEFYNRHIIKGNLFAPIVEILIENKSRYNLLESAVLDLFEYIKIEEIKSLFVYVVENFGKVLDRFDYVQTFKGLRVRYDQYQEKLKDREIKNIDPVPSIMKNIRFRRDHRQLDEEEEMWFDEEDEFETNDQILTTTDEILGKKFESDIEPISKLSSTNTRTLAAEGNGLKFNSLSPSSKAVLSNSSNLILQSAILNDNTKKSTNTSVFLKKSLVDYEGDSDEEDDESDLSERSSPKKPRLS